MTDVRERRVEAHGVMWGQEGHSHWRSLIHQPQTAELCWSSGGRGTEETRPAGQDQVGFSSGGSALDQTRTWIMFIIQNDAT